jgi:hypothetical protein
LLSILLVLLVVLAQHGRCECQRGAGKGDGWGRMRGSGRGLRLGGGGGVVLCVYLKSLFNILEMGSWKSICVSFS